MLNGRYHFVANTPLGAQDGFLNLEAEGETLNGTIEILNGTAKIKKGTVDNNSFSFETSVRTMFGSFKFDVTGSVDGDTVKLHMANPMATIDTEGERV